MAETHARNAHGSTVIDDRPRLNGQFVCMHVRCEKRLQIFGTSNRYLSSVSGASARTLTVRAVQPEDAGVYTCQVNTDPPIDQKATLTLRGTVCVFFVFASRYSHAFSSHASVF